MEIIDLTERASFSETFSPQILRGTSNYKVPLICMEPGQEIPPHPQRYRCFLCHQRKRDYDCGGERVRS